MRDIEDTNRQVERTMSRELAARKPNKSQGQGSTRNPADAPTSLPGPKGGHSSNHESAIIADMIGEE